MSKTESTYGERIRAERLRLALTQAQVCATVSVSKPTQIAYEGGGAVPMDYLDRVEALGMDRVFIATGQTSRAFAAEHFNWDLLGQVLSGIHRWETRHRRTILAEKRGTLARLLYLKFIDAGTVDDQYLDRLVDMAA